MIIFKPLKIYSLTCIALLMFPPAVSAYEKNLLLENQTIAAGAYITEAALNTITAGPAYVVEPGAHVSFFAGKEPGDRIVLRPGFSVKFGASFRACNGEMNGSDIHGSVRWSKTHYINGDLIVHPDAAFVISPGTEVVFISESNGSLRIYGALFAEEATFTSLSSTPGAWNGIVVEDSGVAQILNVIVEYARQGILVKNGSDVNLAGCLLRNNLVGVHVIGGKPSILGNLFYENLWYGVKEDGGGSPSELTHNIFSRNGNSYYSDASGVIPIDVLNTHSGYGDNVER